MGPQTSLGVAPRARLPIVSVKIHEEEPDPFKNGQPGADDLQVPAGSKVIPPHLAEATAWQNPPPYAGRTRGRNCLALRLSAGPNSE